MTTEEPTPEAKLHVFQSSVDWWVAASIADAEALHLEHYGESVEEMGDELAQLPEETVIKIVCDEHGQISDSGESVSKTAAEWAAREGRGMLASTEY